MFEAPSSIRLTTTSSGTLVAKRIYVSVPKPNAKAIGVPIAIAPPTIKKKKMTRLMLPSVAKNGRAKKNAATTTTLTAKTRKTMPRSISSSRVIESTSKSAIPTKMAAMIHERGKFSTGVTSIKSSTKSFCDAGSISSANAATISATVASNHCDARPPIARASAVSRMCSLRRHAITAPSIESQSMMIVASSSVHTSAWCSTYREKTPLRRIPTSRTRSKAATGSVTRPIAVSIFSVSLMRDYPNFPEYFSSVAHATSPNSPFHLV